MSEEPRAASKARPSNTTPQFPLAVPQASGSSPSLRAPSFKLQLFRCGRYYGHGRFPSQITRSPWYSRSEREHRSAITMMYQRTGHRIALIIIAQSFSNLMCHDGPPVLSEHQT
ncbi:hypothetical protein HYDPIDRAFT_112110 [Hydnomerulius pinastri MD-312]|uniref:Unplaced genomic scaffold scaffold_13, whole genome shotgun sequence n=1 Tax=Hydnomerulius pinastri MD-312 TaxID=994086 RepID=A0A0C9VFC7_9AGAM|nr:hypothetical protein HYDPIDRAFT_112110 [Hydnomerulius pinastri MD-312]